MKIKVIIAIGTICLLMAGCKSGREAFLEEYMMVADEIVRLVDTNPTAAGVAQAQAYLDSKKASLKSKFNAGKSAGQDKEMENKFRVIVPSYLKKVAGLSEKHPNLKTELDSLTEDFGEFLLK
ncbi:MAG: hypothetical protein ACR2HX_24140 [Pyrinomonadaceae bacterium]